MKLLIVLGLLPLFSALPLISKDLGLETKTMADNLAANLLSLSEDPKAFKAINKIFNENNTCLRNTEEVAEAIQEIGNFVEAIAGDLQSLNNKVESLTTLTEETKAEEVVSTVATILRALDAILDNEPSIAASKGCSRGPKSSEDYLRSLAVTMHQLSFDPEIAPSREIRNMFHRSGNILSALAAFLGQLRTQSEEFQNFCFPNKESTERGIRALGNIIGSVGDMFSILGDYKTGENIRKGKVLAERIANQIPRIEDLNVGVHDCSETDLDSAASTMEDLAKIIEEIGIEKLLADLGLEMSFLNSIKGE